MRRHWTFGTHRAHPSPTRSRPILAVALCTALLMGACAQRGSRPTRVSLLPAAEARGRTWQWTSACQFGPSSPRGCSASGPNLRNAQLTGDEWNLGGPAAAGSVGMTVGSHGDVTVRGDLASAPPCTAATCIAPSAGTWVRGFPSVSYGLNQCAASTSPPASAGLALPLRVGALPSDLIGTTVYDAQTSGVTYDVAYDLWLNPSATARPCRTNGTVEVMVWTDYDTKALLPAGMVVGTATIPFAVNGTVHAGARAWAVYASNVYGSGRTAPWGGTLWLVLDRTDVVPKGAVAVDLSSALGAAATVLQRVFGWADFTQNYWLDTIPFGVEFGPAGGDPYATGPARFSLDLTRFCLEVGTTVADATC